MEINEAERIYQHPREYSKEKQTECLRILNAQPRRLTLAEQVVIADAEDRLDILGGVIAVKCRVLLKRKRRGYV